MKKKQTQEFNRDLTSKTKDDRKRLTIPRQRLAASQREGVS
jgi:hypothetical protein